MSLSPFKGSSFFLEQETLPSLLGTGWFKLYPHCSDWLVQTLPSLLGTGWVQTLPPLLGTGSFKLYLHCSVLVGSNFTLIAWYWLVHCRGESQLYFGIYFSWPLSFTYRLKESNDNAWTFCLLFSKCIISLISNSVQNMKANPVPLRLTKPSPDRIKRLV